VLLKQLLATRKQGGPKLKIAPASAFDPRRIMAYLMGKAEQAATALKSAISKVFGIYDADEHLIHIDHEVHESKQNFLKLQEVSMPRAANTPARIIAPAWCMSSNRCNIARKWAPVWMCAGRGLAVISAAVWRAGRAGNYARSLVGSRPADRTEDDAANDDFHYGPQRPGP
jgi:hypothetical protein